MIKISEVDRDLKKMIYDTNDTLGTRLPNPPNLGVGFAETGEIENGLGYGSLYVKNVVESQKLYVRAEPGRLKLTLHISRKPTQFGIDGLPDILDVHHGDGFLLSVPAHGIVNATRGEEFHEFSLMVCEVLFCTMLDELCLHQVSKYSDMVYHPDYSPGYTRLPTSPVTRLATYQMLNSPLSGPLRRLYMETKLKELLVLRFYELEKSLGTCPETPQLNRYELKHLEEAREILEREAFDPPSIVELSRRVGLNSSKLKAGFRKLYNTTVFGYVRAQRMSRALEMMLERGQTVGEAALNVGYNSLSSFSKAFYRHYGYLPGTLVRDRRTQPIEQQ